MVNQPDEQQVGLLGLVERCAVPDRPAAVAETDLVDLHQSPAALDYPVAGVEPACRDQPGRAAAQPQVPGACE
jgi:hypothetical protein